MSEPLDDDHYAMIFEKDGQRYPCMVTVSHKDPPSSTILLPVAGRSMSVNLGDPVIKIADIPALVRSGGNALFNSLVVTVIEWMAQRCIQRPSPEAAVFFARVFLDLCNEPDEKARALLDLGAMFEKLDDFKEAVRYYSEALAVRPTAPVCRYFANNNLAYSLNQLGLYAEAEPYCRDAIRTTPERYNAHKNLGVSLQGQGKWTEAACCFVRAIEACPTDERATRHLENLLKEHPEIAK